MNEEQQLDSNTENIDDNRNNESVKEGSSKEERRRKRKLFVKRFFKGVRILILVLIAVKILQFGIVHHNKSKYHNREYVQQDMLNYLEERYGEEFVMESYTGMGYAYQNYDEMFAYPKGKDKEKYKFQVQGYYNKWGSMNYYDTYAAVKLIDEYEKYISPVINKYYDEYKLFVSMNSEWVTTNLEPDTKLTDLWDLSPNSDYPLPEILICLHPDEHATKKEFRDICTELQGMKVEAYILMWQFRDEKRYEDVKRDSRWWDIYSSNDIDDVINAFIFEDEIDMEDDAAWD